MGRYRADYSGIGEMLRSPEMQKAMHLIAKKVEARAKAIAPVETGEYRNSFEVSSGVDVSADGERRAYGRVTNTSDHAFQVEYGGKSTPKYRVLGKALDAVNE